MMLQVAQDAFARFERKLEEHAEPGRQLQNARALFDLWIDAAEEAYAQVALSEDFRHAFAGLANAQARLRLGVQREVEQVCSLFGMPTRTEVDSAHRKIVELERAVRKLTRVQAAPPRRAPAPRTAASTEAPVSTQAPPPPAPAAAKPTAAKKRSPVRRKAAASKAAPKPRPAAKKKAAKKPARRTIAAAAPVASKREPVVAAPRVVAKKPAKVKKSVAKAVPKTSSSRKAPKKTAAPAAKPASVVSMKDWVARNAARAATTEAPKAAGKTKRGKGK